MEFLISGIVLGVISGALATTAPAAAILAGVAASSMLGLSYLVFKAGK